MKKGLFLFLMLIIVLSFSGCVNTDDGFISMGAESVVEEKLYQLAEGENSFTLSFQLPENGYIKMMGEDATEYAEWPEKDVDVFVVFKNKKGEALYKKKKITEGYGDKLFFEKGRVDAEIQVENRTEETREISLSWAFAPDSEAPVRLTAQGGSAAVVKKDGNADFCFTAEKDGIYSFAASEACIYDGDCILTVKNQNGEDVSGTLFIHGTEWISRSVFLPKGEYSISVTEGFAVVKCFVKAERQYESRSENQLPVILGFTVSEKEKSFALTADGTQKSLSVAAYGTDNFYDSQQAVRIEIADSEGVTVKKKKVSQSDSIDISELRGEYTVKVSVKNNCAVELDVEK